MGRFANFHQKEFALFRGCFRLLIPVLFAWLVSVPLRDMSNVCPFCQSEESASVGMWFACVDCVGRRNPSSAACDSCVDYGYDSSLDAWSPSESTTFRCNVSSALGATMYRDAVIDEYKTRRDPVSMCKDISAACPRMVELRRATPSEFRSALLRVKKHLAPANTSGLEDVLGQGSEVPPGGTSLLSMPAQFSGAGTQAEKVAMEPVDRIRLSRAPHMKYKYLLPNGVRAMDKAWEHFRRVAKQTDSPLARAVANECEYICEARRILSTPYFPPGQGLTPPAVRPEGLTYTLGVLRTLPRMVKDAARA